MAEGAKILVGPLFSTETAGAEPVAGAAGLNVLSFSNNTSVAGSNVFILGTSFENTADRLVAYGLSHGLRTFGVVYPAGLEGETARDAVAAAVSARGATLVGTQSYNLSVEGIQAAAVPAAAALTGAGANAVILTDGPSGGLAFISEALRANGLTDGAVPRHAALGRLGRGAGGAEPAGRRLRRARPRAGRRLQRPLPDRLRREPARAGRARLRRDRRGGRADRRRRGARAAARSPRRG